MANKPNDKLQGEGNYEATRQYNEATKKFVESGRVEQAARDAAPRSAAEAAELVQAERAALLHAQTSQKVDEHKPAAPKPDDSRQG